MNLQVLISGGDPHAGSNAVLAAAPDLTAKQSGRGRSNSPGKKVSDKASITHRGLSNGGLALEHSESSFLGPSREDSFLLGNTNLEVLVMPSVRLDEAFAFR